MVSLRSICFGFAFTLFWDWLTKVNPIFFAANDELHAQIFPCLVPVACNYLNF